MAPGIIIFFSDPDMEAAFHAIQNGDLGDLLAIPIHAPHVQLLFQGQQKVPANTKVTFEGRGPGRKRHENRKRLRSDKYDNRWAVALCTNTTEKDIPQSLTTPNNIKAWEEASATATIQNGKAIGLLFFGMRRLMPEIDLGALDADTRQFVTGPASHEVLVALPFEDAFEAVRPQGDLQKAAELLKAQVYSYVGT